MKIQQILQKCLTDWKNISQLDFCLLDSDNHIFLSTCDKKLPAESKLEEFRQSSALCVSNTSCCLYKIMENHSISYILIVWGKAESTATIGELAVCQAQLLGRTLVVDTIDHAIVIQRKYRQTLRMVTLRSEEHTSELQSH